MSWKAGRDGKERVRWLLHVMKEMEGGREMAERRGAGWNTKDR